MVNRERVPSVPWRVLAVRDWDQLLQASLFVIYGIWSIFYTSGNPAIAAVKTVVIIFDIEFIIIGVLLIVGLRVNSWSLRRRAYIVYAGALSMFGALLLTVAATPFGILAFAFALQGVVTVRLLRRQEQIALRVLRDPHDQTVSPVLPEGFGRHAQ